MTDAETAAVLRHLLDEGPDDDGQERVWDIERIAIERATKVLESHEATLDAWIAEAEQELRHRQEQIVEARQIADQLAYAVMNYFSEPPKPAMQAWAARSWKGDVAST